ncbi:hypothetical protein BST61_g6649 [Cercospora zeina]
MPTGEWFIDGQWVPTDYVTRRHPNYVPFQSLGYNSDLVYPQGANYPQVGYGAQQDWGAMPYNTFGYNTWGFENGQMYPIDNPWFLQYPYDWQAPGYRWSSYYS